MCKRALDKLRVTIKGQPMIAPEVLDQGLVRVNLSGLTGRLWQNDKNVTVIFNADAIALAEHS